MRGDCPDSASVVGSQGHGKEHQRVEKPFGGSGGLEIQTNICQLEMSSNCKSELIPPT